MPVLIVTEGPGFGRVFKLRRAAPVPIEIEAKLRLRLRWSKGALEGAPAAPSIQMELNGTPWPGGRIEHGDIVRVGESAVLYTEDDFKGETIARLSSHGSAAAGTDSRIHELASVDMLRSQVGPAGRRSVDLQEDALYRDTLLRTEVVPPKILDFAWREYLKRRDEGEAVRFAEVLRETRHASDGQATRRLPPPRPPEDEKLPRPFGRDRVLLRRIGEGATGAVYEALDQSKMAIEAVKVLRDETVNPDLLVRFSQEAELLSRARHPNVVGIRTIRYRHPATFIAMELVEGITLCQAMEERKITFYRGLSILSQIAGAVEHLHQQGIVHRDLKPANIMIRKDGTPIVMDFGFAKDLRQSPGLTGEGMIIGTPTYASPEQAEGRSADVDSRSDVFSLGSIMYHVLTGVPPFSGGGLTEILLAVAKARPTDPSGFLNRSPVVREELLRIVSRGSSQDEVKRLKTILANHFRLACAICLRALQKRPTDRYPSAHQFESALHAVVSEGSALGLA